jgi:hypothetical protein
MSITQPAVDIDHVKKYDTVVSSGQAALRALLTLNGGATLAFLTFLGHLWEGAHRQVHSPLLVEALTLFVWGTFLTVLAYGLIFITNCLSTLERIQPTYMLFRLSIKRETVTYAIFVLTVVSGIFSLVCFFLASRRAVDGFNAVASSMAR